MKNFILKTECNVKLKLSYISKFLVSREHRRKVMEEGVKSLENEAGEVNMVAIVLILLIVIALAAIFKESLISLLTTLFERIKEEALKI